MKDAVSEFLQEFLGLDDEETPAFIAQPGNFRNIYLLESQNKLVRAILEDKSEKEQTLLAEYENFETPVCEFLKEERMPEEFREELIPVVQGENIIGCTTEGDIQRVEITVGKAETIGAGAGKKTAMQWLWPQLTGKLRPEVEG